MRAAVAEHGQGLLGDQDRHPAEGFLAVAYHVRRQQDVGQAEQQAVWGDRLYPVDVQRGTADLPVLQRRDKRLLGVNRPPSTRLAETILVEHAGQVAARYSGRR